LLEWPSGLSDMKMNEVIKKRLSESLGKDIKLFLNNGFKYEGKLTNSDDVWVEILDYKTNSYIIKRLLDISNVEVKE